MRGQWLMTPHDIAPRRFPSHHSAPHHSTPTSLKRMRRFIAARTSRSNSPSTTPMPDANARRHRSRIMGSEGGVRTVPELPTHQEDDDEHKRSDSSCGPVSCSADELPLQLPATDTQSVGLGRSLRLGAVLCVCVARGLSSCDVIVRRAGPVVQELGMTVVPGTELPKGLIGELSANW